MPYVASIGTYLPRWGTLNHRVPGDDGRLKPGKLVLMTGMGAGLTWGSALIEWTHEMTGATTQ